METIATTKKKHNFSAGPAILPASVLQEAAAAAANFNGMGLSILEISHRSAEFKAVLAESEALARELLGLSDDYAVLFLTGGASSQFFMAPLNILNNDQTACYVDTGSWSTKAIKEAKNYGQVNVLGSSKESNFTFIPKDYSVPDDARYLHLTSNNTIFGTQYHWWPETNVPFVCDMSSEIFSRPVDVNRFGLIYAGAQKNLGPAGTTMVIVRKDLLGKVERTIPTMLDYRTHIAKDSAFNTPPVYPIYVSMLTMRWVKSMGGVAAMQKHNEEKARLIYDELDNNPCFEGTAAKEDRSLMNVTFVTPSEEVEKTFLSLCEEAGCVGVKGHRSVGGFRASIYNAMQKESVQLLVDLMKEVAKSHG
ncbi:MAG: 3-phosphoserine/phosphohydroxythreonine transaminase [Bacteroidota bacterium]